MGNRQVVFTNDQYEAITNTTNFSKPQILKLFRKFRSLAPDVIPKSMSAEINCTHLLLPPELIKTIPELVHNPFADRILYSRQMLN